MKILQLIKNYKLITILGVTAIFLLSNCKDLGESNNNLKKNCVKNTNKTSFNNNDKNNFNGEVIPKLDSIIINVKDFGIIGDGKKDVAGKLQALMDSLWHNGGGTLYLPEGVYLLKKQKGKFGSLLFPRSNVSIKGEGSKTVLKVADGLRKFNVIYPSTLTKQDKVSNVSYTNFTVDCNGKKNIYKGEKNTDKNAAIGIWHGQNILISGIKVENNSGRQCIVIGNNEYPYTVTNVTIKDCKFNNVGRNVKGNSRQNDHSVIYVQADTVSIQKNTFTNPKFEDDATAMEIHSSHAIVKDNSVNNYATGMNIVSSRTDMSNLLVETNIINNIDRGILFYTKNNRSMKNIIIQSNKFSQISIKSPIIDLSVNVQTPIENLLFKNNFIENKSRKKSSKKDPPPALMIGKATNLEVKNNTFKDILGAAIQFGKIGPNILNVKIFDNKYINTNRNINNKTVLDFNGTGYYKKLILKNNSIINSNKKIIPIKKSNHLKTKTSSTSINNNMINGKPIQTKKG